MLFDCHLVQSGQISDQEWIGTVVSYDLVAEMSQSKLPGAPAAASAAEGRSNDQKPRTSNQEHQQQHQQYQQYLYVRAVIMPALRASTRTRTSTEPSLDGGLDVGSSGSLAALLSSYMQAGTGIVGNASSCTVRGDACTKLSRRGEVGEAYDAKAYVLASILHYSAKGRMRC